MDTFDLKVSSFALCNRKYDKLAGFLSKYFSSHRHFPEITTSKLNPLVHFPLTNRKITLKSIFVFYSADDSLPGNLPQTGFKGELYQKVRFLTQFGGEHR